MGLPSVLDLSNLILTYQFIRLFYAPKEGSTVPAANGSAISPASDTMPLNNTGFHGPNTVYAQPDYLTPPGDPTWKAWIAQTNHYRIKEYCPCYICRQCRGEDPLPTSAYGGANLSPIIIEEVESNDQRMLPLEFEINRPARLPPHTEMGGTFNNVLPMTARDFPAAANATIPEMLNSQGLSLAGESPAGTAHNTASRSEPILTSGGVENAVLSSLAPDAGSRDPQNRFHPLRFQ
ncbi:hypothetical protein N431DRAFT_463155 [Stipitochalara longipes BDJ]|nr:hypothetical protein N431DRAFT_463155 [Stipitochalara longipes BDJ]